jgi:hypothetical protein
VVLQLQHYPEDSLQPGVQQALCPHEPAISPETRLTGLNYSSPILPENGQIHPGRGQPHYKNLYDLMQQCSEAWKIADPMLASCPPPACTVVTLPESRQPLQLLTLPGEAARPHQVCSLPLAHTSPSQGQQGWQWLVFLPHTLWDSHSEVRDRLHIPGKMKTRRQPALELLAIFSGINTSAPTLRADPFRCGPPTNRCFSPSPGCCRLAFISEYTRAASYPNIPTPLADLRCTHVPRCPCPMSILLRLRQLHVSPFI